MKLYSIKFVYTLKYSMNSPIEIIVLIGLRKPAIVFMLLLNQSLLIGNLNI